MSENFTDSLFDFAYYRDWTGSLDALEQLAAPERWAYSDIKEDARNNKNPILDNYIKHTFKRLMSQYLAADPAERGRYFYIEPDKAVFDTGLFTVNYARIYAVYTRNRWQEAPEPYYFNGFFDESAPILFDVQPLPQRATYFATISDLIFDTTLPLRVNTYHILQDPRNRARIPERFRDADNLITLFTGAVALAQKMVEANYHVAVPQFYDGKISFLLPICLGKPAQADVALSVINSEQCYLGVTCLTLDMAYNNARLICKPGRIWLDA